MYKFKPASAFPWKKGAVFLGHDERGNGVGISTERHAITIAGSQSGKGVGVIIPNLLRWPHNALVIDPKGEAAVATAEARQAMGRPSFVFDPFQSKNIPAHLRVTINPMSGLKPDSFTITEDINVISDGLVMRPDPQAAHWDDGAAALLSGLIAWVLLTYPKAERNLLTVRKIQRENDLFAETVEAMKSEDRCGGLCQTGAAAAYSQEGGYFVSNAEKNTRWLDSLAMQKALAKSTFDMDSLKWGDSSLFLVLPSKHLKTHGRFLRLFVRTAIETMQEERDGKIRGNDCLFLLDEFFALGYIDEIATSAGLMAGYGLKLWPILQNLKQLNDLYGNDGASTFFGSSDLQQFFGNMDDETLEYISRRIGNYDVDDLPPEPLKQRSPEIAENDRDFEREHNVWWRSSDPNYLRMVSQFRDEWVRHDEHVYQAELALFNTTASRVLGKPRMPPDQVARLIKKPERGPAKNMIAIVHGGEPICVRLAPYYEERPQRHAEPKPTQKVLARPAPAPPKPAYRPATPAYPSTPRPPDRWTKVQLQKSIDEWFPPSDEKANIITKAKTGIALIRIHKMRMSEAVIEVKKLSAIGQFLAICEARFPEKSEFKALSAALK